MCEPILYVPPRGFAVPPVTFEPSILHIREYFECVFQNISRLQLLKLGVQIHVTIEAKLTYHIWQGFMNRKMSSYTSKFGALYMHGSILS